MDIKAQKDRLEQELKFLKESFEAEVISKDEFDKGKERIERKLNEMEFMHKSDVESKIEDPKKESKDELPDTTEEPVTVKLEDEPQVQEEDEEPHDKAHSQKSSGSSFWKYATIFLILIIAALFAFNYLKTSQANATKASALCSSDAQCIELGKIGKCIEPGKQEAKCQFSSVDSINVVVLTDKESCISCDTSRVLSILNEWIGPINASEVSYSTAKGKELAQKYDADLLPLFIIDIKAEERPLFSQFQKSFAKKDGAYILSDKVAGASVYVNRQEEPKKIDLFVKEGDSASKKAEDNLAEFLSNFDVEYEKHPSTSALSRELGLNIFPTFLVNNKAAFSGVHTAESIKQNYCKLNDDPDCDKTLSTNLK